MKATLLLTILCTLALCTPGQAQKYEREERVQPEDLPQAVLIYLEKAYPQRSRVRHYRELSRSGGQEELQLFFESKFRDEGWYYSVKFDSLGQLYDTERIIRPGHLPDEVEEKIEEDLGGYFQRYRIQKIQERLEEDGSVLGYEIVLRGKHNRSIGYYELQYDAAGTRLYCEPIEQSPNPFFFF